MKHKSHIPRLLKGVLLGAITLSASLAGANNFIMPQKSASLLQREQEAFLNPNVNTIPFEGTLNLHEGKQREIKNQVATYPISTNPILMQKTIAAAQNENNAATDLVVKYQMSNVQWGTFTNSDDEKLYYFTQENIPSGVTAGDAGRQIYYKAAKFKVYNDEFEEIKSFQVSSMDTVMHFTINPAVTSRAFNSSEDWEFIIHMHGFSTLDGSGPIACRDSIFIVNENSKVLRKVGSITSAMLNKYQYGQYQLALYQPVYPELQDKYDVSIYNPKAVGDAQNEMPAPLYHFEKPLNLLSYSNGPVFEMFNIGGTEYYVSSYYEKPFMADNTIGSSVVETNNTFIIEFYDTSFNLVKTVRLPLIGQDQNELSMSTLYDGFYEYMITQKEFNQDEEFEFIYGMSRYYPEEDCEKVDYYLVNEKGEILNKLIEKTGGTIRLMDIPGQSNEYAVLMGGGDAITGITMFKMPEMETVTYFPARHGDDLLSLAFDRVAVNDSYEYVFGLGNGEVADNTIYALFANYDTTGKNTKRVRIDISNEAVRFSPIVQGNLMNPYTFVADEKTEYIFFVGKENSKGTVSSEFTIANDEQTLYRWTDDAASNNKQAGAGVVADQTNSKLKYLYISNENENTKVITTSFYSLPLNQSPLRGEGTQSNPYLISNPAELELVRQNPKACYALECDIDMGVVTGITGTGFLSIDQFEGQFDGRGHLIKNISLVPNNGSIGLFAHVNGGTIKNLRMENITFHGSESTSYGSGAITGDLVSGHIDNCHISNNIDINDNCMNIGGIVGSASSKSTISNSSFTGEINAPHTQRIGGIAANIMSGTIISNCFATGSISGRQDCGGICGLVNSASTISNCYSTANIVAAAYVGGIVSSGIGVLKNNYSTGSVESDFRADEKWKNNAGGIVADIKSGMFTGIEASGNVALNPYVLMESVYARVGNTIYDEATGANDILKNNYALATMKIGSSEETLATVDESDEITVGLDRVNGKSVTEDELTQEFFENLGWKFGNDSINPWRMEGKYPSLWFEYRVQGVKLDYNKLTMGVGQKLTVNATVIPEKAENKKVRYESSDMRVAIVDANGEITARAKGTAVIKAISEDGNYTDQCVVTVINAIESITLDQTELTLYVLDGIELTPTINPEDADNTELIWTSSNPEVATVDNGIVRAIAAGEAEITVKAAVGDASATCKVTVFPAVDEFYFETSSISLNKENPTQQLHVTIKPEEAQNIPLRWESDNEAVATVDAEGLVSAVGDGDAIITAMTTDRLHKADCLVMVTDFGSGIDEVANKAMIIVTDNALTISSDLNISRVMGVDIAGVTVFDNAVNGNQTTVMTSALQPGAYIVKVLYENGNTTTHKIIIK